MDKRSIFNNDGNYKVTFLINTTFLSFMLVQVIMKVQLNELCHQDHGGEKHLNQIQCQLILNGNKVTEGIWIFIIYIRYRYERLIIS